jgi:hypothetical protein
MIVESHIRFWLARLIAGEASVDTFEDWFVAQSWNMHLDSEPSAQKLVAAVELRLAEYSSGHLSEAGLMEELRPFASIYVDPAAPRSEASFSSVPVADVMGGGYLTSPGAIQNPFAQATPSVDRLCVGASGYTSAHPR